MDHPASNSLTRRAESLRRASELAQAERPFAVVTVVRTEPSTSARTGNRALVFPDGGMEGWVGGGCIQPTARKEGLAALEEGEPRLVRITPDTAAVQPNVRMARMTCASEGTADLYVEPFPPRPCRRGRFAAHRHPCRHSPASGLQVPRRGRGGGAEPRNDPPPARHLAGRSHLRGVRRGRGRDRGAVEPPLRGARRQRTAGRE